MDLGAVVASFARAAAAAATACSVVAVVAKARTWAKACAAGVLAVVVKVEVSRAPGERGRVVAAVMALVRMVTAVSVREVAAAP